MPLTTDSREYEILKTAAEQVVDLPGLTCEIGLRCGGGSGLIMEQLAKSKFYRTHIAIDPYGNIEYATEDNTIIRLDYSNRMRNECMQDIFKYAEEKGVNFVYFPLEDTEFMKRYADGVPIYDQAKHVINEYCLVHFDGPHCLTAVMEEYKFFNARRVQGAYFVFDDIYNYDHTVVHRQLYQDGWHQVVRGSAKAVYTC